MDKNGRLYWIQMFTDIPDEILVPGYFSTQAVLERIYEFKKIYPNGTFRMYEEWTPDDNSRIFAEMVARSAFPHMEYRTAKTVSIGDTVTFRNGRTVIVLSVGNGTLTVMEARDGILYWDRVININDMGGIAQIRTKYPL